MSRRYRKRKDRRWIGVAAGVLILAVLTAVLINMAFSEGIDSAALTEEAGESASILETSVRGDSTNP